MKEKPFDSKAKVTEIIWERESLYAKFIGSIPFPGVSVSVSC